MDPLSICASAIALLQAANGVGKGIGKLRSMMAARDEISALLIHVSELRIVLEDAKEALGTLPIKNLDPATKRNLLHLLSRAQGVSANWELFVKERLICRSSAQDYPKINYYAWLSAKPRLQRFQIDLRSIEASFVTSILSTILVQTCFTALRVDEMHICMKEIRANDDRAQEQIQHAQPIQLVAISSSLATEAEIVPPKSMASSVTADLVPSFLTRQLDCCSYYHSRTVKTPPALRSLLGALSVDYNSQLSLQPKRKDQSCERSPDYSITLTYVFPKWFCLARFVTKFLMTQYNEPELLLRLSYVRPSSADIFQYAYNGNTEGIQHLFQSRQASPYDISLTGLTPLHYAIYRDQIETCAYLLSCKADMYASDDYNNKPIDTAWNMFLSKRSSHIPAIKDIFIDKAPADYLETRQFSALHSAVLGPDNPSERLSEIFSKSDVDVDAKDTRGLTALAWAANLDDSQSMRCLLDHGADPNSRDFKLVVPLMRTRDPACLRMLLEKGADINARDNLQQTPLLATEHSNVECAKLLLDCGADIDLPQYTGFTPLHYFVQNSEADLVQLLLSRKAKCLLRANDGSSIVHSAFRWADAKTLHTLAEKRLHGLDIDQEDDSGTTGATLAAMRRKQDPELITAIDAFEASLRKAHVETMGVAAALDKQALEDGRSLSKMSPSNVEAQTFWSDDLERTIRGRAYQIMLSLAVGSLGCIAFCVGWKLFLRSRG